MGQKQSATLNGGAPAPPRQYEPPQFERKFPHHTRWFELTPGFWHLRKPFKVAAGLVDLKTHMAVCQLESGDLVALDCAKLDPDDARELDEITSGGEKLVAVINTHPFHTVAIQGFYQLYPASGSRRWYGCPRHLRRFPEINLAGDLNKSCTRALFEPDLAMDVPAAAEFVAPVPELSNHFANVLVFHRASKTLFNDDMLMYIHKPGLLFRLGSGFKDQTLVFHASLWGPALAPTEEAPEQFRAWFAALLDAWDFEHIVAAHTGCCFRDGKRLARELLERSGPKLADLARKNASKEPQDKKAGAWSSDQKEVECG